MTEPHEYREYRAICRRVRFGVWPGRLWGRFVGVVRHRIYDGDELRRRHGKDWDVEVRFAALNERLEIEGKDETEVWEPLSQWRLDELRRTRELAEMLRELGRPQLETEIASMRKEARRISRMFGEIEGRRPGLGELAYHLIEHERQPPGAAKAICEEMIVLGWEDLAPPGSVAGAFEAALKNGRRRIEVESRPCRLDTQNLA